MLVIRFQRIGRKNDPAFRIVVTEKTAAPKAGKYVDLVGTYNPKTKAFTLAEDRVKDWMGKGAQLSPSLHNLLVNKGIVEGKKVNVLPKKRPIKKDEPEAPAAPVAEARPVAEAPAEASAPSEAPTEEAKEETPAAA
jgi:small subunit ribosomal protein S16